MISHAELARRIAERFLPEKDREAYAAGLTRALDDRRFNRCDCNGTAAAEDGAR